MKKEIREGEELPRGYGIAYRETNRLVAIAYPIPINLIVAYFRRVWIWLRVSQVELSDVKEKAYMEGYFDGKERGKEEAEREVLRQAKEYFIALNKNIKRVFPKVRKPLSKLNL